MADRPEKLSDDEIERMRKLATRIAPLSPSRPAGSAYRTSDILMARWALWLESELTARTASLAVIGDAWARYQRNDISREEFEGTLAEHAAEHVGAAILARTAETGEQATEREPTNLEIAELWRNQAGGPIIGSNADRLSFTSGYRLGRRAALAKARGGEGG